MAEKRYKSFVVTGDDSAKTTRQFFYIGSGKNRSAEAMRQDALDYYEERFQETWFPEITEQRNYNEDPHEFNNLVQVAVSENRAEYTRIPNFGDRWVVTPKVEETTPEESNEEATIENRTPVQRIQAPGGVQISFDTQDDRVGLPDDSDDSDDYEPTEEEERAHLVRMATQYPSSDEVLDQIEEAFPADMGIAPANLDEVTPVQAIGGFHVEDKGKAVEDGNKRKNQVDADENDTAELPTPEEMEEEARRLRENPDTHRRDRGNTGELRASDASPLSPLSGSQTMVAL